METPTLKIGIMEDVEIHFCFREEYVLLATGNTFLGNHSIRISEGLLFLNDVPAGGDNLYFRPVHEKNASFELKDVTIGIHFHWERKEDQLFKGSLQFLPNGSKIIAVNDLPLEDYLISVISSEMSATSSLELLKAHAITSRSWLIAQVVKGKELREAGEKYQAIYETDGEYIRWYDREDHTHFDVCADDHCQRYQGITRQTSNLVEKAVRETSGVVLMSGGHVCDARFSKSCGGITETFEKVWEPVVHPYLNCIQDAEKTPDSGVIDLRSENFADQWIRSSPPAFCNTCDQQVLRQVLNDYDQETNDFFRWKVTFSQQEISSLISLKTGRDFGKIVDLVPIERGYSGRIIRLEIIGTKMKLIIGKELEIRKTLSKTHLYSSAFVVDRFDYCDDIPGKIVLTGAGWGHGVGLCQIGAAMMGEQGYTYDHILEHYFVGAELEKAY